MTTDAWLATDHRRERIKVGGVGHARTELSFQYISLSETVVKAAYFRHRHRSKYPRPARN